ncbi:hypothetical protein V1525DRAFT_394078 [Lipomyces kononenkoae]|uniref:Uncharacterized protein n=1 Tax=Lipomyces kononenkoae TaxID=34357 RepID=A0ACC3TAB2_LIPKO
MVSCIKPSWKLTRFESYSKVISDMQRTLRSVRSAPGSLRAHYLHSSASTPNPTHVLNKTGANYKNLTLENLRSECRKRGLKVSGNKSHLVDRLTVDDAALPFSTGAPVQRSAIRDVRAKVSSLSTSPQAKKISTATVGKTPIETTKAETKSAPTSLSIETVRAIQTTAVKAAKGDSSTIEYYRMPEMAINVVDPISTPIPVMPENYAVRTIIPDDAPVARQEISLVSGDVIAEPIRDIVDNSSVDEANNNEYSSKQSLPARDKRVLTSLLVATLGWWGLGSLTEKKDSH